MERGCEWGNEKNFEKYERVKNQTLKFEVCGTRRSSEPRVSTRRVVYSTEDERGSRRIISCAQAVTWTDKEWQLEKPADGD